MIFLLKIEKLEKKAVVPIFKSFFGSNTEMSTSKGRTNITQRQQRHATEKILNNLVGRDLKKIRKIIITYAQRRYSYSSCVKAVL